MPDLKRFRRTLSIGRMEIDRIQRSKDNVDVTAVGLPARLPGCEMHVGERKASVVLFFEFVLSGVRIWIAPHPELANELVALLVVAQPEKGLTFVRCDDPSNILPQPLFVLAACAPTVSCFVEVICSGSDVCARTIPREINPKAAPAISSRAMATQRGNGGRESISCGRAIPVFNIPPVAADTHQGQDCRSSLRGSLAPWHRPGPN